MSEKTQVNTQQIEALERILSARREELASRGQFPAGGTDNLVSALTCTLDIDGDGTPEETFVMTSLMTIERSEPFVNKSGLRQIDAKMTRWSAKGYSQTLGRTVEYTLSAGEQPQSVIVAQQSSADFPAEVTFHANFDVLIDGQPVITNLNGTAHGTGWMSVPPDGDDYLAVNKAVEIGRAVMQTSVCVASRSVDG
jgi:hypothetical protein